MEKGKGKRKKDRDPLPEHFGSLEEAAEFWDTHDSSDYEEYFEDVECRFEIKARSYLIPLDGALYDRVQAVAKKKRVPAERLVSRWIEEKLPVAAPSVDVKAALKASLVHSEAKIKKGAKAKAVTLKVGGKKAKVAA